MNVLADSPAPVITQPTAARKSRAGRAAVVTAATLLLLVVAYLWPGFDSPILAMDEGMLLAYPEQIASGRLPYRDFETFYTPANLFTLLGAYETMGFSITVERAVGLLYRLAIFGAIFAIVRRRSLLLAVAAVTIAVLIVKPTQLTAFAWWGGVACALWSLVLLASTRVHFGPACAGALAGLALLYRQDLGPAVILGSLPLWLSLPRRDKVLYVISAIAALSPLIWLTIAAGWRPLLENLFLYPVVIGNSARRLPILQSPPVLVWLLWLHLFAVCMNLTAAILSLRGKWGRAQDNKLLLGVSLFSLAIIPQGIQRFDIIHLAFATFCSIALLPVAISSLLNRERESRRDHLIQSFSIGITTGALLAVSCLSPAIQRMYLLTSRLLSVPIAVKDREIPLGNPSLIHEISTIGRFMQVYSQPGEKLFVGPSDLRRTAFSDVYLYHLLPWLTPGSYFMEMNPLSANREGSRLSEDIGQCDWLILNRMYEGWREPNASERLGPDAPNEVVRRRFTLRAEIGSFYIFQRNRVEKDQDPAPRLDTKR